MTRRQAGILALLRHRGPMTTFTLARALDERMVDVATDLNRLSSAGKVEHTEDGWQLTNKVAS